MKGKWHPLIQPSSNPHPLRHDHNVKGKWPRKHARTVLDTWARTMGQLANVLMGLLLFPSSRNSMWVHVFGVPWERMLRCHVFLGYGWLAASLAHVGLFWVEFGDPDTKGRFKEDWVPLLRVSGYERNNWTIPIANVVFWWVAIPVFGVLSLWPVRRRFFNLFLYLHAPAMAVLFVRPLRWRAAAHTRRVRRSPRPPERDARALA